MALDPPGERMVAGYRVLRTLAHGERSEILLGFDPRDPTTERVGSTVALKVIVGSSESLAREVEALSRARGEHVVDLIDISVTQVDACLVLGRLERGALSDLISRRTTLDAGEVVTIVAPLAATLMRLHAAGVAHGRVSPGSVAFSSDGAPVLIGFGSAELFVPGSPEVVLERVPAVIADRRAIRALTIALLGRVGGARRPAALELIDHLPGVDDAEILPKIREQIFELATAGPVRFEAEPESRAVGESRVVGVSDPVEPPSTDRPGSAWLASLLPDSIRARLESLAADPRVDALRDRWRTWPQGRRRAVLGGGAGALALVIALTLIPAGGSGPIAVVPAATQDPPTPEVTGPIVEDDPVGALHELLRLRTECIRDLSILCLDRVDQAGSAALDDDRAVIGAIGDGGEIPVGLAPAMLEPDGDILLIERLGDSALVDLPDGSTIESVLLIRGESGWRIRDYIAVVGRLLREADD